MDANLKTKLKDKAIQIKKSTLQIHKKAQGTRIASSLSPIEIFVVLFYGGFIKFDPKNQYWKERDRLIISKGHGSICMYPLLADIGFFNSKELDMVCQKGSFLGSIPDPIIPGYETVNGSLGHGLGVGCGISIALNRQGVNSKIYVVMGDGELYEGAVWEAALFAGGKNLGNLVLIIDNNKKAMLNYLEKIVDLSSIADKFKAFGWNVETTNGHDIDELYNVFQKISRANDNRPTVVIADTIKGKGIKMLEESPLCHILSIEPETIEEIIDTL